MLSEGYATRLAVLLHISHVPHIHVEERSFRFQSELLSAYFTDVVAHFILSDTESEVRLYNSRSKKTNVDFQFFLSGAILISSILCFDRLSALRVCVML